MILDDTPALQEIEHLWSNGGISIVFTHAGGYELKAERAIPPNASISVYPGVLMYSNEVSCAPDCQRAALTQPPQRSAGTI